jgi:hypothetical protein
LRRAEGGAKIVGVFRVKNHDFTQKKIIFANFRGGARRVRPPLDPPLISRSELIAKILIDIIEEDKQNDIGSIVFVTRTLVKRSSCFITQEEADEIQNLTETLLKDLF